MTRITRLEVQDVRFPTSLESHGSDAMNPDPDYSAAYVTLHTDGRHQGHGIAFTLGRGTDLCVAAVRTLADFVTGISLKEITTDLAGFWRRLTSDSQLRWLGPDKGVVHLAVAAVVNAVWDLWAKQRGVPLWRLLCELTPEQLVGCIDFRYLHDAITPEDAVSLLKAQAERRDERVRIVEREGYPAYTTSAGWLGYSDERIRELCLAAIASGWQALKFKVGQNIQDDRRRLAMARQVIGPDRILMVDANQVWEVEQAIAWMRELAEFAPYWIEEPTSPDDIMGHARIAREIRPIRVATGEMVPNRIVFKQLMLAGALSVCQLDSCRLGGVNEVLAVILMAAKFRIPVCPHGGGVGLCEHIQHLSVFDFVAVSGTMEARWAEYVDHLHEHFTSPVAIRNGRYVVPTEPGYGITMKEESIARFRFPDGEYHGRLPS